MKVNRPKTDAETRHINHGLLCVCARIHGATNIAPLIQLSCARAHTCFQHCAHQVRLRLGFVAWLSAISSIRANTHRAEGVLRMLMSPFIKHRPSRGGKQWGQKGEGHQVGWELWNGSVNVRYSERQVIDRCKSSSKRACCTIRTHRNRK